MWRWVIPIVAGLPVSFVIGRALRAESDWDGVPLGLLAGAAVAVLVYLLLRAMSEKSPAA
jgi:hypothetical protein